MAGEVFGLILFVATQYQNLWTYALIGLGGALGSMSRYFLGGLIDYWFTGGVKGAGVVFPLGTIIVNVTGCFIIGFIDTLTSPGGRALAQPNTRNFLMIGILGGYTTFSSFSLQSLRLAQDGQWLYAALNVGLSVILCLLAVWLGSYIAQTINR